MLTRTVLSTDDDEIARRQMGSAGEFFAFDQTTTDAREAGDPVTIDLGWRICVEGVVISGKGDQVRGASY